MRMALTPMSFTPRQQVASAHYSFSFSLSLSFSLSRGLSLSLSLAFFLSVCPVCERWTCVTSILKSFRNTCSSWLQVACSVNSTWMAYDCAPQPCRRKLHKLQQGTKAADRPSTAVAATGGGGSRPATANIRPQPPRKRGAPGARQGSSNNAMLRSPTAPPKPTASRGGNARPVGATAAAGTSHKRGGTQGGRAARTSAPVCRSESEVGDAHGNSRELAVAAAPGESQGGSGGGGPPSEEAVAALRGIVLQLTDRIRRLQQDMEDDRVRAEVPPPPPALAWGQPVGSSPSSLAALLPPPLSQCGAGDPRMQRDGVSVPMGLAFSATGVVGAAAGRLPGDLHETAAGRAALVAAGVTHPPTLPPHPPLPRYETGISMDVSASACRRYGSHLAPQQHTTPADSPDKAAALLAKKPRLSQDDQVRMLTT
jgi:hypothetical protein